MVYIVDTVYKHGSSTPNSYTGTGNNITRYSGHGISTVHIPGLIGFPEISLTESQASPKELTCIKVKEPQPPPPKHPLNDSVFEKENTSRRGTSRERVYVLVNITITTTICAEIIIYHNCLKKFNLHVHH